MYVIGFAPKEVSAYPWYYLHGCWIQFWSTWFKKKNVAPILPSKYFEITGYMVLLKCEVQYPDQELNPQLCSLSSLQGRPAPYRHLSSLSLGHFLLSKFISKEPGWEEKGWLAGLWIMKWAEMYKLIVGKHFPMWSFLHLYQESSCLRTLTYMQGRKVFGGENKLREDFLRAWSQSRGTQIWIPLKERLPGEIRDQGKSWMDLRSFPSITQAREPLYEDFLESPSTLRAFCLPPQGQELN